MHHHAYSVPHGSETVMLIYGLCQLSGNTDSFEMDTKSVERPVDELSRR